MRKVIQITEGIPRQPLYRLQEPVNFTFEEGEQLAIVGPNGAGKSILVNILIGKYPLLITEVKYDFGEANSRMVCENLHYIAFRDSYGESDATYYYQQRWNSQDAETSPSVRSQFANVTNEALCNELFDLFGMRPMLDKQLVMLSSGELRKLQLTKTLLTDPRVLIMDNPFIGLDAPTRQQLRDLLSRLITERHLQLILVLSRFEDIPDFVTHVLPVQNRSCGTKVTYAAYKKHLATVKRPVLSPRLKEAIQQLPVSSLAETEKELPVIDFRKVSLRYGTHTVLQEVDWTVMRGEKWALQGKNGAGKSALLGLVCADNPQSYACDIRLFGRKRGTGESIWDIKRRIGYVSPEMHRAYLKGLPAIEIVASGLHDSIGLYARPHPEQMATCEFWMEVFGVLPLKDSNFLSLSSGEQRLILLARAFVKDPELLILDEPLHGLDAQNRQLVKEVIEAFCSRERKTLLMVTHYAEELPPCITHSKTLVKAENR